MHASVTASHTARSFWPPVLQAMAEPRRHRPSKEEAEELGIEWVDVDDDDDDDDDINGDHHAALPKSVNNFQDLLREVGGGQALKQLREAELMNGVHSVEMKAFRQFDDDKSGSIDADELESVLREHGYDLSTTSAEKLLQKYDADSSGTLEFPEFTKLCKELELLNREKKIFEDDIDRLKRRISDSKRGLINPRGQFIQIWDMMTAVALVYTILITPYEVGLDLPSEFNALMVSNMVINVIFLIDIIVQVPFPSPPTPPPRLFSWSSFTSSCSSSSPYRARAPPTAATPTSSGGIGRSPSSICSHGSLSM